MKKILLITGITIIVILAGVWAYLLFFGSPESGDGRFSLFGFGDTTDTSVDPSDFFQDEADSLIEISTYEPLRQLTTNPVVGYREVQLSASSSPLVYYVEAGTGHVYTIDVETGSETRISNITVPAVKEAEISIDGSYAALVSGKGTLTILQLPSEENSVALSSFNINEDVFSFSFTDNTELLYAVKTNTGVTVKVFDLINKQATKTLFTTPFTDLVISWGKTAAGTHYYYPKPSSDLLGYLYEVMEGVTTRTSVSGFGLRAVHSGESVLFTTTDDDNLLSIYNKLSGEIIPLYLGSIPEKCSGDWTGTSFMCGLYDADNKFRIEDWYTGDMNLTGNLREINASAVEILPVIDMADTGRILDVSKPSWNGETLLFTNKNDKSLWFYSN